MSLSFSDLQGLLLNSAVLVIELMDLGVDPFVACGLLCDELYSLSFSNSVLSELKF